VVGLPAPFGPGKPTTAAVRAPVMRYPDGGGLTAAERARCSSLLAATGRLDPARIGQDERINICRRVAA